MAYLNSAERVEKLKKLAWLLDSSIRIPGTDWRIGLDGLIGLIPGFGDVLGALLSLFIVYQAWLLDVSGLVIGRMFLNILLEMVAGMIPLIGDIFDFGWKTNIKNCELMERDLAKSPIERRRAWLTFYFWTLILAVTAGLGVQLLWTMLNVIFHWVFPVKL